MNTQPISLITLPRQKRLEAVVTRLRACHVQLSWAVDTLIPEDWSLDMPSASGASVLDLHLPEALVLRDDMADQFLDIVSRLPAAKPADPMRVLRELDDEDFSCFSRLVAGAFFMDERVNARLGYTGQQEIRENADYDALIESIQTVIDRGEIYTKV